MNFSTELITLAAYLAGEFDNEAQAIADPAWYVHLRWWHRPIPLFAQDSLTLFAEQANVLNLDRPYRPRILRLQPGRDRQTIARIQYYGFRDPEAIRGAARDRLRLERIAPEYLQDLPGCTLTVVRSPGADRFRAVPPPDARCCFTYTGKTRQVELGFEVGAAEFLSYDKGVDPDSGKTLWGAILGPYRFAKHRDFSDEFSR